jgi:prepilin-type N-terminal cleavage/methylation domain-containing protein
MEHNFLTYHKNTYLRSQAFTLLELLISIAIIGILISAGVASYSVAQKKARDSRRMSDMKAVQSAFEQYYAANDGKYPDTANGEHCSTVGAQYLPAGFPTDPKSSGTYTYNFNDVHCRIDSFCFCAHLESGLGNASGVAAGATCSYSTPGVSYYCVGSLQ